VEKEAIERTALEVYYRLLNNNKTTPTKL